MTIPLDQFIRDFTKEIRSKNAAIFAGAGVSIPAGFVDWKGLLREIISDLGLDPETETDYVTLAQYHCNEKQTRNRLTQTIFTHFAATKTPTANLEILARLPIHTYWTTNYDKLIETALTNARKVPDVKYTMEQLTVTRPERDAVVYKMHGDIDHPTEVVITKDDYEKYPLKMGFFISALKGDLISKTFLFLGFSFTDPNIDYILSRVRATYEKHQRLHYCILRKVAKSEGETPEAFEARRLKQEYFIKDLKRFGIQTVFVSDYQEITSILQRIENRYKRTSILVSGAAHDYGLWAQGEANEFLHKLSYQIVSSGNRVITGFGLGVGSAVINGALASIEAHGKSVSEEQLVMRPFPQIATGGGDLAARWTAYRRSMASSSGIAIYVFGNKLVDGKVVPSGGIQEEFQIACEAGVKPLPIGCTGYIAEALWKQVLADFDSFYPSAHRSFRELFEKLGTKPGNLDELLTTTNKLIQKLQED